MSRRATLLLGAAGYRVTPDLLSPDERERLYKEARVERPYAQREAHEAFRTGPDGRALAPNRQWIANPGDALRQLHRSRELASAVRRLVRRAVRPTICSYLYYGPGDFVGLHSDNSDCPIVLLAWLGGPAGPLYVNPELQDLPARQLLRTARRCGGHPEGGVEIQLKDGAALFAGSRLPHHRPPHRYKRELTLAALCFCLREVATEPER
jgi:hypothetical protein